MGLQAWAAVDCPRPAQKPELARACKLRRSAWKALTFVSPNDVSDNLRAPREVPCRTGERDLQHRLRNEPSATAAALLSGCSFPNAATSRFGWLNRRPATAAMNARVSGRRQKRRWPTQRGAKRLISRKKGGGDPSRIRTCNPRSRNPLLYPVELWDRLGAVSATGSFNNIIIGLSPAWQTPK